ncbi:MAG: 4Fe-4S dicluster domain-containing protein [Planctomycetota bacterium]|jgi:ferredoxin
MPPQILTKDGFNAFVAWLMADNRVVAPVAKGPNFAFEALKSPEDIERIRMDYDISILSPKKFLLPTYEKLLGFGGRDPASSEPAVEATPTVVLGVHPYDLHAIGTIDAAMSMDPADANFLARRAATRIIGLNIQGYANEHQFMADMGTAEPPGGVADLFLTDIQDRYFVEIGTEAGSKMRHACDLFAPAGPGDHKARQEYDAKKAASFPKRLPYHVRYLSELLDASYDSLLWDAVARRCFSCGACTNVCPTCFCFDVQDKLNIDAVSGLRRRMWDSCQLKVFAEVAGGENFREHRASRLRHRVFRKGKYIADRTGKLGCVGCGRCSLHCVADISILEAFQQIAGETAETGG